MRHERWKSTVLRALKKRDLACASRLVEPGDKAPGVGKVGAVHISKLGTPREPGSIWSSVNIKHAQVLIEQGRMQTTGLKAYEARR